MDKEFFQHKVANMKQNGIRKAAIFGLSILICSAMPTHTIGGGIAVSEGSKFSSDDGYMLAFVYNQTDDHRLVVIDEKNRRRYEAPLNEPRMGPFWEGGKVYVVGHSGSVQGFSIGSEKLVADKEETKLMPVVRDIEYVHSQHRLYLIRTFWDTQRKLFNYELSAIDFPERKTLWTKKIIEPGILRIYDPYICITGEKLVQAFNCETGEKIGGIQVAKPAASTNDNVK
jgi:hypothetical protein